LPDEVRLPLLALRQAFLARVFVPVDLRLEPASGDHVHPPVAVDVEGQVAVVPRELFVLLEVAEGIAVPVRRPVPPAAGDEVRLAVLVHVGERDPLVAVVREADLLPDQVRCGGGQPGCAKNRKQCAGGGNGAGQHDSYLMARVKWTRRSAPSGPQEVRMPGRGLTVNPPVSDSQRGAEPGRPLMQNLTRAANRGS